MKIPFSPPDITEDEVNEVAEALRSGWITTGPKTKELEKKVAEYTHSSHAAALNSATACMEMALRIFGIGEGDEVIVPAYTYTASASVVCHVGATLRFADVAKDSYHIDYEKIPELITEKTKAIIPVDIAGIMVDYDRVRDIVMSKKDIFVPSNPMQETLGHILILADSAHGFGASRDGVMSGQAADFTSFSFHAVKNFTTAEGGALVWRDVDGIDGDELYRQLMLLSLHGQSKDALAKTQLGGWEYDIVAPYYKCNMTDVHAAIGLAQFRRYDSILARRRQILKMYTEGIERDGVEVLRHFDEHVTSSGHLCLVRLKTADVEARNAVITRLAERGIATNVHYKPLPMHTAYKNLGFDIKDFPESYEMFKGEITLPLHTKLTDEQVGYVIENFNEVTREL